jgi:ribosome-associated protein
MEAEFVSRTKKKQTAEELQRLGVALVALPPAQLDELALPAILLAAVLEAQRITSHGALRRQVQFIGKVMRKIDPEPVRTALAAISGSSAAARARHQRLEQWRERLLADDGALTAFATERPGADLQAMRALIRNARKEIAEGKPPRAQRELFRVLREALEGQ